MNQGKSLQSHRNEQELNTKRFPKETLYLNRKRQPVTNKHFSLNSSLITSLNNDISKLYNQNHQNKYNINLLSIFKKYQNVNLNIKGKLLNIEYSIYKGIHDICNIIKQNLFNCLLTLINIDDDNNYNIYKIKIEHIRETFFQKIKQIPTNTNIYFTNLKINIKHNNLFINKENKIITNHYNNNLTFIFTLDSNIFIEQKQYNKTETFINGESHYIQLNTHKEFDFIENITFSRINDLISILPSSYFDYTKILEIDLKLNIISRNNNLLLTSISPKSISVCGLISNIVLFKDSNKTIITIISCKDANPITINIYNNKTLIDNLEINMLVLFFHYQLKVTNSYDIILTNGIESHNEIIGKINSCKLNNQYKNISQTIPFNNLISLISKPILIRTISKYLITITQILHIVIQYEYNNNKIKDYPHLKLKAKFLFDDGTSKALGYIYDKNVFTILNLNNNENITKIIKDNLYELNSIVLYSKYYFDIKNNYITNQHLNEIYNKQYIIEAIPFMNTNLSINTNTYIDYINNKLNGNTLSNPVNDIAFINGTTYIEKSKMNSNYTYYQRRPCLKIVDIEEIN